eukprot:NODE_244_length_13037_cov_0.560442.p2 type:complete len:398 gc:universal NODE_244_length_13037_cov_0.560442:2121-3314(+)
MPNVVIYYCKICNTLISDSTHLVGTVVLTAPVIIFDKAFLDLKTKELLKFDNLFHIGYRLKCKCNLLLGFNLISSDGFLQKLLGLFCIKESLLLKYCINIQIEGLDELENPADAIPTSFGALNKESPSCSLLISKKINNSLKQNLCTKGSARQSNSWRIEVPNTVSVNPSLKAELEALPSDLHGKMTNQNGMNGSTQLTKLPKVALDNNQLTKNSIKALPVQRNSSSERNRIHQNATSSQFSYTPQQESLGYIWQIRNYDPPVQSHFQGYEQIRGTSKDYYNYPVDSFTYPPDQQARHGPPRFPVLNITEAPQCKGYEPGYMQPRVRYGNPLYSTPNMPGEPRSNTQHINQQMQQVQSPTQCIQSSSSAQLSSQQAQRRHVNIRPKPSLHQNQQAPK